MFQTLNLFIKNKTVSARWNGSNYTIRHSLTEKNPDKTHIYMYMYQSNKLAVSKNLFFLCSLMMVSFYENHMVSQGRYMQLLFCKIVLHLETRSKSIPDFVVSLSDCMGCVLDIYIIMSLLVIQSDLWILPVSCDTTWPQGHWGTVTGMDRTYHKPT